MSDDVKRLEAALSQAQVSVGSGFARQQSVRLAQPTKVVAVACLRVVQARATHLESTLAGKERELALLQKGDAWRRDQEAESAVSALERAARAEEQVRRMLGVVSGASGWPELRFPSSSAYPVCASQIKRLEPELSQLKARAAHLEHVLRNRCAPCGGAGALGPGRGANGLTARRAVVRKRSELAMDKLRSTLADKVTREERLVARDKQVYARLRSAFAAHRADLQKKSAAGAAFAGAGTETSVLTHDAETPVLTHEAEHVLRFCATQVPSPARRASCAPSRSWACTSSRGRRWRRSSPPLGPRCVPARAAGPKRGARAGPWSEFWFGVVLA